MRYYTDVLKELSGLTDIVEEIEPKFWRPIDIQYQDVEDVTLPGRWIKFNLRFNL